MQIQLNNTALQHTLQQAAQHLGDATPLMKAISEDLVTESLLNFQSQGRPAWAGLSPKTKRKGGMILQVSAAGLKASVVGSYTATTATVGAGSAKSTAYAAIHQFGGMAGRGRKVKIPERRYLPMDKNGNLQPEAQAAVEDACAYYLSSSFNP